MANSGLIHGEDYAAMLADYNSNDRMMVMLAGSAYTRCVMTRTMVDADKIRFRVEYQVWDGFDYDADYVENGYNQDFEKILTLFGQLSLQSFDWTCSGAFEIEVSNLCEHRFYDYCWDYTKQGEQLTNRTDSGFNRNDVIRREYETNQRIYTYFELDNAVILRHDQPWIIEYTGKNITRLFLTPDETSRSMTPWYRQIGMGETAFFVAYESLDPPEELPEDPDEEPLKYQWHARGTELGGNRKYSKEHVYTYHLENRPAPDGSNMVWMWVYDETDGVVMMEPTPMDEYHRRLSSENAFSFQYDGDTWLSGVDLMIGFVGNRTESYSTVADYLTLTIHESSPEGSTFQSGMVAATCASEGYLGHTCIKCGYTYRTDVTPQLPHNYEEKVTAATCTAEGYTAYTCRDCGYFYHADIVEKLPHSYDDFVSNNDATCAHDGTKTGQCTVCGERVTVTDEGTALPHTWTDATCEKAKTCKFCGATEGEPLGHDLKHYNAKAPTCENVGWDAYEKCLRCTYSTFARLPALGHDHVNGVCTRCGDRDGSIVPGEVTGDGKIDMADAYQIILYLSGKAELTEVERLAADVNGDGGVDMLDVYRVMLTYKETIGRR